MLRDRLALMYCEAEVLRLNQLRTLSARLAGRTPGPEASILKIMSDDLGQRVMELAAATVGASGMLTGSGPAGAIPKSMQSGATEVRFPRGGGQFPDVDPIWHYGLLFSPALTLGGGTFAVQRNIVAEQVLGLPREPNVEARPHLERNPNPPPLAVPEPPLLESPNPPLPASRVELAAFCTDSGHIAASSVGGACLVGDWQRSMPFSASWAAGSGARGQRTAGLGVAVSLGSWL